MEETNNRETKGMDERAERETKVQEIKDIQLDFMIGTDIKGTNGVYHIKKFLATGGEAVVFLCESEGEKYVAKVYKTLVMNTHKRNKFVELLYKQECPYIVPLLDYGTYQQVTFDIYPYMENGNLMESGTEITLDFIKDVIIPEVNEALAVVHSHDVSHRDIKPQNILLSNDGQHIMLHDFSIMSVVENSDGGGNTDTWHKTSGYAAPEIWSRNPHVKSDYYALGISLLCLLNGGKDIYAGMDEDTIRRCTVYSDIPYLNPEKFIDASIFSMSLKDRIEGLVCGLTLHSVKERWGYKEVKEWCEGKKHFPIIKAKDIEDEFKDPFTWNGAKCYSLLTMAEALAKDWDNAKKEAGRGTFADWLKSRRPDLASAVNDIVETINWRNEEQAHIGIFKIIYTIAPDVTGIYWKGKKYLDFNSLAVALETEANNNAFQQMLKNKIISWFVKKSTVIGELNNNTKQGIEEIEKTALHNTEKALYMFLMLFLPNNIERNFRVNGHELYNVSGIVEHIKKHVGNLGKYVREYILSNNSFKAWMWFKGYDELCEKTVLGIENINDDDCLRRFLVLLDTIADDTSEVRNIVLEKGEYSHIFWLKMHLDQYEYVTDLGRKTKYELDSEVVDTYMSVEEIYSTLQRLDTKYKNFVQRTYGNPFKIAGGTVGKNEVCHIIPKTTAAAFVHEKNGLLLPAGYVAEMTDYTLIRNMSDKSLNIANKEANELRNQVSSLLEETKTQMETLKASYYSGNIFRIVCDVFVIVALILGGTLVKQGVFVGGSLLACAFPIMQIIFEILNLQDKRFVLYKLNEIKRYEEELKIWWQDNKNVEARVNNYYKQLINNVNFDNNYYKVSELIEKINSILTQNELLPDKKLLLLRKTIFVFSAIGGGVLMGGLLDTYVLANAMQSLNAMAYLIVARVIMYLAVTIGVIYGVVRFFDGEKYGMGEYLLVIIFAFAAVMAIAVGAGIIAAVVYFIVILVRAFISIIPVIFGIIVLIIIVGGLLSGS